MRRLESWRRDERVDSTLPLSILSFLVDRSTRVCSLGCACQGTQAVGCSGARTRRTRNLEAVGCSGTPIRRTRRHLEEVCLAPHSQLLEDSSVTNLLQGLQATHCSATQTQTRTSGQEIKWELNSRRYVSVRTRTSCSFKAEQPSYTSHAFQSTPQPLPLRCAMGGPQASGMCQATQGRAYQDQRVAN